MMQSAQRSKSKKPAPDSKRPIKQGSKAIPKAKFKETDGKIEFHGPLGELRGLAKKSPYLGNRAIMRAAVEALHDECYTSESMVRVAFGMTHGNKN
jgi:hypothetical protein